MNCAPRVISRHSKNMTQKSCMMWVLFVGLLGICAVSPVKGTFANGTDKLENCFTKQTNFIVNESFYGVITEENPWNYSNVCIEFLKKNTTVNDSMDQWWPQMQETKGSYFLYLTKRHTKFPVLVYVLWGRQCNQTTFNLTGSNCPTNYTQGNCRFKCLQTGTVCESSTYNENVCKILAPQVQDKYIVNITDTEANCYNCDNPLITPTSTVKIDTSNHSTTNGGTVSSAAAAEVMSGMASLAATISESAVTLSAGEGITGVLVAHKNPVDIDQVSFAYKSSNGNISIISSAGSVSTFSRSVTVPKEAFEKALSLNISVSFASLMRFINMERDALNSTVLGNEVLAVEMGASIANLTHKITLSFLNVEYNGYTPSCHSWDGRGSQPNWTNDGCETLTNGSNIFCQCSHLTFFAILMAPLNQSISSTDLNNLTIITQAGCGLSMFFLAIVLFMHFLMRRTKASKGTRILIHLVLAMFLLDFAFLINNFVAKLNNSVFCIIMAALMHYFMLATFTWFAAQAFHLCLQLYTGGKIGISHYMLKVSITSWIIPSVIGIVLLAIGKYGEQIIYTNNTANNVAMCWITDSNIHYIVNIGYYVVVFLFTFSTFIIILSWLFCLRSKNSVNVQVSKNGKSIVTILGLCCMLGITWGFAFFAYGALQIPGYYIFTILNSFQGFFLFIYYYNTRHTRPQQVDTSVNKNSTMSTTTLQTNLDILENPYNLKNK